MIMNARCLAQHVAALVLQALKALHARPLIFKVGNLAPSSWQIKPACRKPSCQKPGTFINIPKCVHTYIVRIDP